MRPSFYAATGALLGFVSFASLTDQVARADERELLARFEFVSAAQNAVGALFVGRASQWSFCTASLIGRALILTNDHCVPRRDGEELRAEFRLRDPASGRLERFVVSEEVARDRTQDLLILRLEEAVTLTRVFPLAIAVPASFPKHPWRLSSSVTGDYLNDPRPGNEPVFLAEMCNRSGIENTTVTLSLCSARPGNSGSPLVNEAGEIVGVLKGVEFTAAKKSVVGTEIISGQLGDVFATLSHGVRALLAPHREKFADYGLRVEGINFSSARRQVFWP